MPFGLSNAPAAFQCFMNKVFTDLLDVYIVVYLDDILIFSSNLSQHSQHVCEVLKRLKKHGLYCKASKCEFSTKFTKFLGYICTPEGLKMDDSKVQTIKDWPHP